MKTSARLLKATAILLMCALTTVVPGAALAQAGTAVPYVPASDDTVLEHLPSTSDPRVRHFNQLRARAAATPANAGNALALASAYLDYARDTGDARYLGRAEAVIAPWLARTPASPEALVLQATILQSRHQFVESRRILEAVIRRDDDNPQAWLTLASVALVQGDMDEAHRDCARLMGNQDALVTAGCLAAWSTANGHAQNALRIVDLLLSREPNESPALQAWAHGLMADAAKMLGQTARADAEFAKALQFAPGDNYLIADYADFLLDQGRARQALDLTRGYAQSDTSFLRQVMAEAQLGMPAAMGDTRTMASRFRDLEQRGDSRLYGREEARFALVLLHDPARALRLAQANWSIQRAPEDVRIFLQAALAAGRPDLARPVLDFVQRTHLEDPVVRELAQHIATQARPPMQPASGGTR